MPARTDPHWDGVASSFIQAHPSDVTGLAERSRQHAVALARIYPTLVHPSVLHLAMPRAHGLSRKVSRTRRNVVTEKGRRMITALLAARRANTEQLIALAA
jgi:hypothetical protein